MQPMRGEGVIPYHIAPFSYRSLSSDKPQFFLSAYTNCTHNETVNFHTCTQHTEVISNQPSPPSTPSLAAVQVHSSIQHTTMTRVSHVSSQVSRSPSAPVKCPLVAIFHSWFPVRALHTNIIILAGDQGSFEILRLSQQGRTLVKPKGKFQPGTETCRVFRQQQ